MSESKLPRDVLAIKDVTETAFWGIPFEDMMDTAIPFIPDDEEVDLVDAQVRNNDGYDFERGCGFSAAEFRGSLHHEGSITALRTVIVGWEDGLMVQVDTDNLTVIETLIKVGDDVGRPAYDDATLLRMVKQALSQISTL